MIAPESERVAGGQVELDRQDAGVADVPLDRRGGDGLRLALEESRSGCGGEVSRRDEDPYRVPLGAEELARGDVGAEADEVDALLFASKTPLVSMELRDRVLAAATQASAQAGRTGRRWLDRLTLAFGAGWAAAACAGVVAGVFVAGHLTADVRADAVLYQATLNGVDDVEVLG